MNSFVQLVIVVAVAIAQANAAVELNMRNPMTPQTACTVETVAVNGDSVSVNLFANDNQAIKDAASRIAANMAMQFVYNGYASTNTFRVPCSQMYYLVGTQISYDQLSGNAACSDADLQKAYQTASDIAFAGKMNPDDTKFENDLNTAVLPNLKCSDFVNLYNGKLDESQFFNLFISSIDSVDGSEATKTGFRDSFKNEQTYFQAKQANFKSFIDQIGQQISS